MSYRDQFKTGDRVWIMMRWGPWAKATVTEDSPPFDDGVRLLIDDNQPDQRYRWNKEWVAKLSDLESFLEGVEATQAHG